MAPEGNIKRYLIVATCLALFVIGVVMTIALQSWRAINPTQDEAVKATRQTEQRLTQVHSEEVKRIIENYYAQVYSPEVLRNPSLRSELVVTPYLDSFRQSGPVCNTPPCFIIGSAHVKSVRVLDYSPQRFKADVYITLNWDRVTAQGEYIGTATPDDRHAVYVYVYAENKWKLAGMFDITIPNDAYRDWWYAPDWLKEAIGSLPEDITPCSIQTSD